MKIWSTILYKLEISFLVCLLSLTSVAQSNSSLTNKNFEAKEAIRVVAFSETLVKFQACKIIEETKAICRNLGDGLYNIRDIEALKSKVTTKFWIKAVGAAAVAAGVATAATFLAPAGAVFSTMVITGGSHTAFAFSAAVATISAVYGAGYGAAICPKTVCIVSGAVSGAALAMTNAGFLVMTGSAFVVAPVAAGVLAFRGIVAATGGLSNDYKLMTKMFDLKNQMQNQQFNISTQDLEEVLKHVPSQMSQTEVVHEYNSLSLP